MITQSELVLLNDEEVELDVLEEGVNAEWIDGELIEVPTYDRE